MSVSLILITIVATRLAVRHRAFLAYQVHRQVLSVQAQLVRRVLVRAVNQVHLHRVVQALRLQVVPQVLVVLAQPVLRVKAATAPVQVQRVRLAHPVVLQVQVHIQAQAQVQHRVKVVHRVRV